MTAEFVCHPRRAQELTHPQAEPLRLEYTIVRTILLDEMDFENFSEDLLADRQFIEANAFLCKAGYPLSCLLVRTKKHKSGILVVPERQCHVKMAAHLHIPSEET